MAFCEHIFVNLFKYKRKISQCLNFSVKNKRHFMLSTKSRSKTPKILFFGTDNFSLPSLKTLNECTDSIIGTVTSFKSPANCVRLYAEKHQLPLYRFSDINAGICKEYQLGVVVSFGHMIPEAIINALPLGMINVHASLLPRWRGAAPIIYAIMSGDTETGVSIMRIEAKHFDIGDILAQRTVPISEMCLMPELHAKLAQQGAALLLEVVNDYHEKSKKAEKQNNNLATYAPKVTTNLTEINWAALSAQEIYRRYRALYSFKSLITRFDGKNVQLIDIKPYDSDVPSGNFKSHTKPGSFVFHKDRRCLVVRCALDTFLEINKLRVEGRKIMSALDFNNGFLKKLKSTETCFVANKNTVCC